MCGPCRKLYPSEQGFKAYVGAKIIAVKPMDNHTFQREVRRSEFFRYPNKVTDANRILGREEFILSDRLSPTRPRQIFDVIMAHYNPEKDIHLALKIWNSRAPLSYHNAVINKRKEYDN